MATWNLVTTNLHTNPRLFTNSTGYTWAGTSGGTSGRVAITDLPGFSYAYQITRTNPATGTRIHTSINGLTVGATYTFSTHVYASGPLGRLWIGTGSNDSGMFAQDYAAFTGWQRVYGTFVASATTAYFSWRQNGAYTGTSDFRMTGSQLELGSSMSPYVDGSLTDTASERYTWLGVEDASESTKEVFENAVTVATVTLSTGQVAKVYIYMDGQEKPVSAISVVD